MSQHGTKKISFSPLSLFTSQVTIAAILATSASGCDKSEAQGNEPAQNEVDAAAKSDPLAESAVAGGKITQAQFFDKLQATVPADARTRIERAFENIKRSDESLEGTSISRIIPMHFLYDAKVQQMQITLVRDGQNVGYMNLALAKQGQGVWFDSHGESSRNPVEVLLAKFPDALRATKIYQIGLVDLAAEDEQGNLVGYIGLRAPAPSEYASYWRELKDKAPAQMPDQDEVYPDEDVVYPSAPGAYTKGCKDNKMKKKILPGGGLPIWGQFTIQKGDKECWVGCTPLAVSMVMSWMDVRWPSVNYFTGPGIHSVVDASHKTGNAPDVVKRVGEILGTYCGKKKNGIHAGSTSAAPRKLEKRLNNALRARNYGKTDVWSEVISYNRKSSTQLEEDVFNELYARRRPVLLNGDLRGLDGWDGEKDEAAGHSWTVDGVRYPSIEGCEPKRRKVRMNWGWAGHVVDDSYETLADTSWFRLHKFSGAVDSAVYFKKSRNGCDLRMGHRDYCDECGPCGFGEGHCESDSDCKPDLYCKANAGEEFGLKASRSVCFPRPTNKCKEACRADFRSCIDATLPGEKPDVSFCKQQERACLAKC